MLSSCCDHSRRQKKKTKQRMRNLRDGVLYKQHGAVKIGELNRFVVEYTPKDDPLLSQEASGGLWLKVKNLESMPLRAAYLIAPFILYVDVRTGDYDQQKSCFITAEQPVYEPNVQAGQGFYAELSMHTIKEKYVWIVDVASQILFTDNTEVNFEVLVGKSKTLLEGAHSLLDDGNFAPQELKVTRMDTVDLWNSPAPDLDKPIHLVLLTHGMFSNVGTDLHYLKESIDKMALRTGENILVKGYQKNVCKTEKGVKYLGKGVAEYIIKDLMANYPSISKISFIGHSLGGLTQTYAIAYLAKNYPGFFDKVRPENFITLASPLLGVANENPAYVKLSLTVGLVGKTGQDLGLFGASPLLLNLPKEPTHAILKAFKHRTVYANVLHDGIVPLRTSALLYLDWRGLVEVTNARKNDTALPEDQPQDLVAAAENSHDENDESVAQIPDASYGDQKEQRDMIPYLSSKVLSPFQTVLSICAPMVKQDEHEISKYRRFQTARDDDDDDDGANLLKDGSGEKKFKGIPKSSIIQSATKVLIPPLPPKKFICDPASRENVILHDKVYSEEDLPPQQVSKANSVLSQLNPDTRFHKLEEEIARLWHKDMSWRKVLVNLKPDAHNNIFVRRRFVNAFGWGVIDHLVEGHFSKISNVEETPESSKVETTGTTEEEAADDTDWINDEEEEGEEAAYDQSGDENKRLDDDPGRTGDDITNDMIMSGYYN